MWLQDIVYNTLGWFIKTKPYLAYSTLVRGDLEYRFFRINQINLTTAKMHEKTFTPFKNKFAGREVAVIACGPSVLQYKPLSNVINIGVNRSYKDDRIQFDYMFLQDAQTWSRDELDELNTYRIGECTKFYGISCERLHNDFPKWLVSESDAIAADALRYRTSNIELITGREAVFPLDISVQPLADFESVVFSALQFALWTHPKRIYLVGCDCSTSGHFYETGKHSELSDKVISGYVALKKFATAFYPDTEIVSINPVGLKGLFSDINQIEES